jgi:hypothetical protein
MPLTSFQHSIAACCDNFTSAQGSVTVSGVGAYAPAGSVLWWSRAGSRGRLLRMGYRMGYHAHWIVASTPAHATSPL